MVALRFTHLTTVSPNLHVASRALLNRSSRGNSISAMVAEMEPNIVDAIDDAAVR